MTKRIKRVAFGWMGCLFLLLSLGMVRWPLFAVHPPLALDAQQAAARYRLDSSAELPINYYQQLPPALNQRTIHYLNTIKRGSIYDRDRSTLAYDDNRQRIYTDPSSSHAVGHVSTIGTGIRGVEATYNHVLLGQNRLDTRIADLVNLHKYGSNLWLTIDSQIQQMAALLMADHKGAVVVLDAGTGAIRALYSAPHYDATRLLNDPAYGNMAAQQGALINRAKDQRYAASAIAPLMTVMAALDLGQISAETTFDLTWRGVDEIGYFHACEFDGQTIIDRNQAPSAELGLHDALAYSADCVFANLSVDLSLAEHTHYANGLGVEIAPLSDSSLARAHLGIGKHLSPVSPLQMATLMAAIANNGTQTTPYLVESIHTPRGSISYPNQTRRSAQVMQAETAAALKLALIDRSAANTTEAYRGGLARVASESLDTSYVGFVVMGKQALAIAIVLESAENQNAAKRLFEQIGTFALAELSTTVNP